MGLNTAGSELQQPSVLVFTSITWGVFVVLSKAHEDWGSNGKTNWTDSSVKHSQILYVSLFPGLQTLWRSEKRGNLFLVGWTKFKCMAYAFYLLVYWTN